MSLEPEKSGTLCELVWKTKEKLGTDLLEMNPHTVGDFWIQGMVGHERRYSALMHQLLSLSLASLPPVLLPLPSSVISFR